MESQNRFQLSPTSFGGNFLGLETRGQRHNFQKVIDSNRFLPKVFMSFDVSLPALFDQTPSYSHGGDID